MPAKSFRERSEQRPCEGSLKESFEVYELNKITHSGNKGCSKVIGGRSLKGNTVGYTILVSWQ